jgi:cupin 2 domain-containing protein
MAIGETQNLFAGLSSQGDQEDITILLETPHCKVERIVSTGQASPPGFWYDQDWTEWVTVLSGSAGLRFAEEDATRVLQPGDHIFIPAHCRHRVEWTDASQPTVWLAIHYSAPVSPAAQDQSDIRP